MSKRHSIFTKTGCNYSKLFNLNTLQVFLENKPKNFKKTIKEYSLICKICNKEFIHINPKKLMCSKECVAIRQKQIHIDHPHVDDQ